MSNWSKTRDGTLILRRSARHWIEVSFHGYSWRAHYFARFGVQKYFIGASVDKKKLLGKCERFFSVPDSKYVAVSNYAQYDMEVRNA